MHRPFALLSCAIALTTTAGFVAIAPSAGAGAPPDDDFDIDVKRGRMVTSVDGERTRDRVDEGSYEVSNANSVSGEFGGDELSIEFDLDADQRRRGRVFKLSGDDVTADTPSGTVAYDNARGKLAAKQNRRGDHASKIKIKANNADGDRLLAAARGRGDGDD